jgi:hypothetical protein
MFRILATILLLAGLTLGQSGNGSFADSSLTANGVALTTMHGEPGRHGQSEEHRDAPSHGCPETSCSQTFLTTADLLTSRALRSAMQLLANERNRRSTILEQDPPIPRSLI